MPRSEDLLNLKPLVNSESPKMILSTCEAQELHTASWQVQKHIPRVHRSSGIFSLVRFLVLSGLNVILSRCATVIKKRIAKLKNKKNKKIKIKIK